MPLTQNPQTESSRAQRINGHIPKVLPMKSIAKSLLLAALIALACTAVSAQQAPTPASETSDQSAQGRPQIRERITAHRLKRAAELKSKLALRPEQEPAWEGLMAALKPQGPAKRPARAEIEQLSTPERLDKILAQRKQRDVEVEKRIASIKVYYATLTPEQQRIFDTQTARPRHNFIPPTMP